ncbi:hypothetical protein E3N88_24546 [Mikania micrantha]|uniref:Myb/SANT-like domain-containing protein n=1 Tax=Mikania micrantha TaxID=192012 RepID=A0A5N6N540_9ASTR|nr:hypothetical protein E3N88_24546 [Mikania micrantha]
MGVKKNEHPPHRRGSHCDRLRDASTQNSGCFEFSLTLPPPRDSTAPASTADPTSDRLSLSRFKRTPTQPPPLRPPPPTQPPIQSNKYVEALRSAPLPYPEICIHLFEGSTSNGFDSWGPSSTLPHPVEEVSEHNLNGLESIECTQIEPPTQGVSEESSGQSKKKGEKRKVKETLNSKLIEVGDHITKVAKMLIEKQNLSNDMDACMEKLGTLGWEEFDAKYQTALLLFGESSDIRKVWLRLQPHTCELWVRNAGAKYGLF